MDQASASTWLPRGSEHDPNAALSIHDLTVAYDRRPVLWDVDLDIPKGCLAAIVGPNGAGKSTLIKACLELLPRISGDVRIFGSPWREVKNRVAYVPQRETVDWDFPVSVLDVVVMGTFGRLGWLRPVGRRQKEAARQALERVGLLDVAERQISELSGGQQQRVFLARALVQDADLYLMDEPFASVDAATEQAIVEVMQALRSHGSTLVVVHHDLQTLSEYFEHVVMLNMRVVASGPIQETLTKEHLRSTYGGRLTLLEQAATALGRGPQGS